MAAHPSADYRRLFQCDTRLSRLDVLIAPCPRRNTADNAVGTIRGVPRSYEVCLLCPLRKLVSGSKNIGSGAKPLTEVHGDRPGNANGAHQRPCSVH